MKQMPASLLGSEVKSIDLGRGGVYKAMQRGWAYYSAVYCFFTEEREQRTSFSRQATQQPASDKATYSCTVGILPTA